MPDSQSPSAAPRGAFDVVAEMEKWGANSGRQSRAHRAAFQALKGEISRALQTTDWSKKDIWQMLRDRKKISMGYRTFLTHCTAAGVGPRHKARPAAPRPRPAALDHRQPLIHDPDADVSHLLGTSPKKKS